MNIRDKKILIIVAVLMILIFAYFMSRAKNSEGGNSEGNSAGNNTVEVVTTQSTSESTTESSTEKTTENKTETTTETVMSSTEDELEDEKTTEEITEEEYTFRNNNRRDEHYEKHGKYMGFDDAEEYEEAASDVVNNPESLHKTEKEDGDDVYYLKDSNEFVIVSPDGYIRTYFNPDDGIAYYNRQ